MSNDTEPEKVWHYKDPSGNVQGPFTLLQLSKWTSYFPRDLRVWLTFESEERSLLLTEVLSKQQKDFTQAASHTSSKATLVGTGDTRNSPSVDQTNAFSPVGHSVVSSSGITVQYNKYSVPERESVYSPDDSLSLSTSSVPLKDAYTVNSQAHCQNKHFVLIQSPGSSYGHTDLNHDAIQGCSGESNHHHSSGALWSPTVAHMSCSGRGNVESHQNQHVSWSQRQHESKNSSQRGPVKDLMNSRQDLSKNLPTQRIGKDVSSPLFAWSPAESRTASSQHEGSCLSSTTNPSFLDELHSSIASAKPKSHAPATPIEDRGSSSPSGMLSHAERVPICSPQSAPSASVSDMSKMEEIMNQQRTLEADTSNASVNQSPESKIFPVSSPDNQDTDREFPSPVPRSENKDTAVYSSGLTPASHENITMNLPGSDTCKMEAVSQQQVIGTVVLNSSDSHSPQSKVSPVSSPNNEDMKHEYPSSTPRSENKIPAVDSLLSTSAAPENLITASAHDSDTCKMEFVNQPKTLEADASNAPLCQSHSHIFPVPSDNQDIKRECPCPTPNSDIKEPLVNNSATTSASASDTSKMEEFVNQQKTLEADASNSPLNQSHSHIFPVPSDNHDIERECPGSTPRSDTKELVVDNSVLTSAAPEILTTTSAASDSCKMESVNQQKTLEADASNAPLNHHPHSHSVPVSSDNQDIQRECPSPTPKSDSKEPLVDNSILTSVAPEMLATTSASDTCKMEEFVNQQKALEADATNASLNQPPHIFNVSSDNQDIEHECPSPTPRSDCKEPLMDNSVFTSAAPEILATSASGTCKMEEFVNQQRPIKADASNASLNQPPHCHIFTVSSNNQDIECECPSPTPRSDSKEPLVENLVLTSAVPENLLRSSAVACASDTCKMEILNKKRTFEADASLNQPPHSSIFASSSGDNQDNVCEHPSPSPRPEGEQPLMDNSGLTSTVPQNLTSSASASKICKMEEILNEKRILEANPSNGSITQSPQSKVFLVPSPDILEREFSSKAPRPEFKEPAVDSSGLTSAAPENLMTKQHVHSPDAFVPPKSCAPTGELGDTKSDFKGEEIIQKEQYCESESIVATRENLLIDPSCGAESIDVSDVLESLMEERGETSYMPGSVEDFLAASAEEEVQYSSPIALSPWGEPNYYQGDAVDSALWGIQDDMWSLLSPRPMLQPSSGIGTEKETYDINEVAVTHVNSELFQRGSMITEENVNQANLSALADWMLSDQVPSILNGMSTSSVDESTIVLGSQASNNQSLDWGTTWTNQNISMHSNEKAEPSSKSYREESRKQETTNSSVSISGEAIGNKGLNSPDNANRGSQLSHHHRGRYSQISESWLLSSNHSRSRSDRFGSGGSSRSTSKGQSRG